MDQSRRLRGSGNSPSPGFSLADRLRFSLSTAQGIRVEYDLSGLEAGLRLVRGFDLRRESELAARHAALRARLIAGEAEEALLPEALALGVEAARRALSLEVFDAQLLAALALRGRNVVQMQTGEGKTLAAALAAAAGALAGGGFHVITANDYLARRDAAWMGPLYAQLGLRAAAIGQGDGDAARREAYRADISYLSAREAGFDYLRDGMRASAEEFVQRGFAEAIVDEADSILIDEARVPLVMAAACGLDPREALLADRLAAGLAEGRDYSLDREGRRASLSARGRDRVEEELAALGFGEGETLERGVARVHAALVARCLLVRDVDYILRAGRAELVDGFTGRVADQRRWPWGVQAALEAREGLEPGPEGRIHGSLAVRHLAALYPRLAAMTATALAAAPEFSSCYGLGTVIIPPELPSRRIDLPDLLFRSAAAKNRAVIAELERAHAAGRPVLVGTASVRESEEFAAALGSAGLPCVVLNARNDGEEARIIAAAGRHGAITISTNMAGRGTDIRLAGPPPAGAADLKAWEEERLLLESLGGLLVLGTNRHESRRVDDQLRGRAGRQGEPGATRFLVSLEDPLFRRYGVAEFLPRGILDGGGEAPIDDPRVRRELERAQAIIEGQNHRQRAKLASQAMIVELERRCLRELRDRALLSGELPEEVGAALAGLEPGLALRIFLAVLDEFQAEHLEYVEELREGSGLARLGGRDPDIEYLRRVAAAFEEGLARLGPRCAQLLEAAGGAGAADAASLEGAGLRLPSTTWTWQADEEALPGFSLAGLGGTGNLAAAFAGPLLLLLAWMGRIRESWQARRRNRASREWP